MRNWIRIKMAKTIRSDGHAALCIALVDARSSAGLTQVELSDRLSGHQLLIARIESGERRIDVAELIVLARAMDANAFDILRKVDGTTDHSHHI